MDGPHLSATSLLPASPSPPPSWVRLPSPGWLQRFFVTYLHRRSESWGLAALKPPGPQPCLHKGRSQDRWPRCPGGGRGSRRLKAEPKSRPWGSGSWFLGCVPQERRLCAVTQGGLFTRLGESCLHREGARAIWLFFGPASTAGRDLRARKWSTHSLGKIK